MKLDEVVMQDFGDYFREQKRLEKENEFLYGSRSRPFEEFWWKGYEGYEMKPIGSTSDYKKIKDDASKLKEFLGALLDRGRIYYGTSYWNQDGESDTSHYAAFLYQNNSNEDFKRMFEQTIIELLNEELQRPFAEIDRETALKEAEEKRIRFEGQVAGVYLSPCLRMHPEHFFSSFALTHPETEEEEELKARLEAEVEKVTAPITLEEVLKVYGGTKEKLTESWDKGNFNDAIYCHYEDISNEIKQILAQRHLDQVTESIAIEKWSPQFNRLIGLLSVVSYAGEPENGFSQVYPLLKEKAFEEFHRNSPRMTYTWTSEQIHNRLLIALNSVQKRGELRDFWVSRIKNGKFEEAYIAVHGLLDIYMTDQERASLREFKTDLGPNERKIEQIPTIIAALQDRIKDFDKETDSRVVGDYVDRKMLDYLLRSIVGCSYRDRHFSTFNRETSELDVLVEKEITPNQATYRFARFDADGKEEYTVTYDLENDLVSGDSEVAQSLRLYQKDGFDLTQYLRVTSMGGREIKDESFLYENFKVKKQGKYEGIIGLNNNQLPFIYDSTTDEILFGEELEHITQGARATYHNFDEIVKYRQDKVPYSSLKPVSERSEEIQKIEAHGMRRKFHFYSDEPLLKPLTENIADIVRDAIQIRFVKYKDGLVEVEVAK